MKNFFLNNRYKLLFLILVIGIYMFVEPIKVNVNKAMVIMQNVDVELVREYILGFGVWAPIVSFILMILQSVVAPLPAFIITFANAAIFGWVYGAILSWSSAMAGAALCFFIARLLGRDAIEKLTSKSAVKKADDFFKDYGTYAVLIARLLPFISFDIVSYAAGLTGMRFWSFFIA
ncbi:MAG: TVP38/TMEM64 family protein, partial [Clostridium sp.]